MTDDPGNSGTPTPGSRREVHPVVDEIFDISGSDPELLSSGRIPDPRPEHTPLFQWIAGVLGTIEEFLRARGGAQLRVIIRLFWGFLAVIGVFLLVGPVINKQLDFDDVIAGAALENVDWIARDAQIDYVVSRADDGSFVTTVREEFKANFVNGPEQSVTRRIVTEVNGHDAEFALHSATIEGEPAEVVTKRHPTNTDIVLTRPDGEQFSGEQTVAVEYELHHLTRVGVDDATGIVVDEWNWPLFAPTWPQATKGIEVSLTFSHELNGELVRSPRATLGWLLLSTTSWLSPDGESADGVRYAFSNDDTLPPNADVWVFAKFTEGTFTQPPATTLFWVQTYGPLIPLALLALTALCGVVARRVIWADSAGKPWYVARSEPPKGLGPVMAAQLLGKPRHAELVEALANAPKSPWRTSGKSARKVRASDLTQNQNLRSTWLAGVAQAGRRAGLMGNLPSVLGWSSKWRLDNELVERKLRWIPDSYVRDTLVAAPIALTALQWGLLRQLSHQVILLVVWWPVAFVLITTALAIFTLWAVNRPRPLTRQGAIAVQELKGIGVFARSTTLIERGPLEDPLLPYAVPFAPPRQAGDAVAELAIRETGERSLTSGWRSSHFLSIPSMLGFVAAIAVFAGSIVLVSTSPPPYAPDEYQTWPSSEFAGDHWTQSEGFEIEATVEKGADGGAKLTAVERQRVQFTPSGGSVPQYSREWQSMRAGQDLGFAVQSVTVDGEEIQFRTVTRGYTTALVTQLTDVLNGLHDIEIRYSLEHPVVELADGPGMKQQLRWAASLGVWDDEYYVDLMAPFDGRANVRPLKVQLTLAPEVAAEVKSGGWLDYDHEAPDLPFERARGFMPWVYENSVYLYDDDDADLTVEEIVEIDKTRYDLRIGAERTKSDGTFVATFDVDEVGSRVNAGIGEDPVSEFEVVPEVNDRLQQYELDASQELGAVLNFAPGTFTGTTDGAYKNFTMTRDAPLILLTGLTVLMCIFAAATGVLVRASRSTIGSSGLLTSFGTITLLAVAQTIVFWWVVGASTDSGLAVGQMILGLLMWAVVGAQWVCAVSRVNDPKQT